MKTENSENDVPKQRSLRQWSYAIVFGAVFLVILGGWQWLFFQMNRGIQEMVTERSGGSYRLDYEDYGYSFTGGRFYLEDLAFGPVDRGEQIRLAGKAYSIRLPRLEFTVGSVMRLLFYGELNLSEIRIMGPEFQYDNFSLSTKSGIGLETGQLHDALSGFIQSLEIERFVIEEMHIKYRYLSENDTASIELSSVSIELEDVFIDSTAIEMQDRFLFADHLKVLIRDQSFQWKGEMNGFHFDTLILSSSNKYIKLSNAKWIERDSSLMDTILNIHVQEIRLSGIDFLRFYQLNELHIDTFLIGNPSLVGRSSDEPGFGGFEPKKHSSSAKSRIDEILSVVPVFDLDLFLIYDFQIDYQTSNNQKLRISQLNLKFIDFKMDSTDTLSEDFFPRYTGLELVLNDPEFSTSDTSWSLKANTLFYNSNDERILLNGVILKGHHLQRKLIGLERSIELEAKKLILKGFDLKNAVQSKQLGLRSVIFDEPGIVWETGITSNNRSVAPQSSKSVSVSLTGAHIDSLIYNDGSLEMISRVRGDANGSIGYFKGYVLDVDLTENQTFSIDELLDQRIFFQTGSLDLGLGELDHTLSSTRISLNTITGEYKARDLVIEPTTDSLRAGQMSVDLSTEEAFLSCPNINELIINGELNLRDVILRKGALRLRSRSEAEEEPDTIPRKTLRDIQIGNLSIADMDIEIQKNSKTQLKLADLIAFGQDVRVTPRPEDSTRIQLFTHHLYLGFNDLFLPMSQRNEVLRVQSLSLSQDSNKLMAHKISYTSNPTGKISPANKVNVLVPRLNVEGILTDTTKLGLHQNLDKVWVSEPIITMERASSSPAGINIPERFSWDRSYMPFDTLSISELQIDDGILQIKTSSDSSFSHFGSQDIDLSASGFIMSPSSSWSLERMLWFDDLSFKASDLSLETSATAGCQEIDSIRYTFDPNELSVFGTYYAEAPVYRYGQFQKQGFSIFTDRIKVSEPQVNRFIRDEEWNIQEILIDGAQFEAELDQTSGGNVPLHDFNVSREWRISDSLNALRVDRIKVQESSANVKIHTPDRIIPLQIGGLAIDAEEFRWKPGERWDSANIFFTDNINLHVEDLYTTLDSGLMEMNIAEIQASTSEELLTVRKLWYVPTVFRYEYARWKGRQCDVFNINMESATAHVNYSKFLNEKTLASRSVEFNGLNISVLKDKRVAEIAPEIKPLYGTLIKKLPITLDVREARASTMKVRYEEFAENGIRPGYVNIDHVQIYASNITNDSSRIAADSIMNVSGQGSLMNEGYANIQVDFNLASLDDEFYMTGTVGRFDAVQLNKYIEPVGFIQLQSGDVQSMNMYAFGNDDLAIGRMGLYYNDLRIKILDQETMRSKGLGAALRNAVGNTIVKSKNKYRKFKRRKPIYFERNKYRSFLNYLVKIALSGASTNIGLENYKRDIRRAEESENRVTVLDERTIRKAEKKASKEYKKRRRKEKKGKSID